MSDFLLIYLPCTRTSAVNWVLWSDETSSAKSIGQCSGVDDISELASLGDDVNVCILLPGEWVAVHNVILPKGSYRHINKVLPSLLEDELCEDIESLHFAVISAEKDSAVVAVISHKIMQCVQSWLTDAGIYNYRLLPDWMTLPVGDKIYGKIMPQNRCLLRSGKWIGVGGEDVMIPAFLDCFRQIKPDLKEIHFDGAVSASTDPFAEALRDNGWSLTSINKDSGITSLCIEPDVDLLVGPYALHHHYQDVWNRWKKVGISALLLLVLITGERAFSLWSMTNHAEEAHLTAEKEYRRIFPQQQKIVNLRAQLNAMSKKIDNVKTDSELLTLLLLISSSLYSDSLYSSIEIIGVRYDQKQHEIHLQLRAQEFKYIDDLQAVLSVNFDVQKSSLLKEHGYVSGSLILKVK